MPGPRTTIVDDVARLESHAGSWDALARARSRPFMAPALQLAWWHHARTGDARLRAVVVHDGEELIGIAPTFAQMSRLAFAEYRFLGAGSFHRLEPLAVAGREPEVAAAVAVALRGATPRPSSLVCEGFDGASPWPALLGAAFPERVQRRLDGRMAAPVVLIDGDLDAWMAARSRNFREKIRYNRRKLVRAGATWRRSTGTELAADLAAMYRMHHARWAGRGGSGALGPAMERVLLEAGRHLVADDRFRLWTMEVDGSPIASSLFVSAGEDVAFWGGGLAPGWERNAPGVQLVMIELEYAFEHGARRLDLGGGPQDYKRRFTDDDAPLAWSTLFPIGARWPLTRLQLAPKHTRSAARDAARRLPPERQEALKRVLRRSAGPPG